MSALQSRNPAMGVFTRYGDDQIAQSETRSKAMTIGGTVSATGILLAIVAITGVFSWNSIVNGGFMSNFIMPAWIIAGLGGLVVSFVIFAKPKLAPIIAPIHAVFEGVFVGAISYIIPAYFLSGGAESAQTGSMQTLILQAVLATFGIAAGMLVGYATGVLRVGPLMQKVMMTMMFGLVGYSLLLIVLSMFGVGIWNGFADTGAMGIGFTLLCVGLASLFLVLDFQFIEAGVKSGAPKHMEWVGAWGLMVTLVWLYIEVLRLLAKLRSE